MPGPYKWRHRFQGHVCRWTLPREAILDFLSRTSKHMSAKEIYATLYSMYPGIGLTTVYRTLDLLVRSGMINRLSFGDGQNRYEFRSGKKEEHHQHLICTKCGRIINCSDLFTEQLELIKKAEDVLTKKYNFTVLDHNIEFYGLCEKCKKS